MTTSVSTNFWKRIVRLWKKPRGPDFGPIVQAVEEYFEAGHHDVMALADSMYLTPRELYFMMPNDSLRCNILPALPEKEREELRKEICARVFDRNKVQYQLHHISPQFHDLGELEHFLFMQQHSALLTEELNAVPPIIGTPFISPRGERSIHLILAIPGYDMDLGVISGLTDSQEKLLMVKYGQANPS